MNTPYYLLLSKEGTELQRSVEQLLSKYKAQPVGSGFIDIILPKEDALALTEELAKLPVAVECFTWWCHSTPTSEATLGCPHGMGGPINRFGEGYFSECVQYPDIEVSTLGVDLEDPSISPEQLAQKCFEAIRHYLYNVFPSEPFYSECLCPGLWLYVPDNWRRKYYFIP